MQVRRLVMCGEFGVATLEALVSSTGSAQESGANFYRDQRITLIGGYSTGSGYDIYARSIARHLGKQILGNLKVVVTNMPDAESITSVNNLYAVAPKDGSVITTFGRVEPLDPLIGTGNTQFDATKLT